MSETGKLRDLTWRIKEVVLNNGTKMYYPQFQIKYEVLLSRPFRWWKRLYESINNRWGKERWFGIYTWTDKRDGKKFLYANFYFEKKLWGSSANDDEGSTTMTGAKALIDKFDSDWIKRLENNQRHEDKRKAQEQLKNLKNVKQEIVHPLEEDEDSLIEIIE